MGSRKQASYGLNHSKDFENFILNKFRMYADIYMRLKDYSRKFNKDYEYVFYNADREFTLQYQIILSAIRNDDTQDIIDKKIKMVSCFIDQFISIRVFNLRQWIILQFYTRYSILQK
jgi:hypothetical protein